MSKTIFKYPKPSVLLGMVKIITASVSHIPLIREIAEKTWWPTYSTILTKVQIEYMLEAIYSAEALKKVMSNGTQNFLLLEDERGWQGFASYGLKTEDPSICKLHKIYVLPDNHGKGYGKMLIEDVKKRTVAMGADTLDLNVNRFNQAKGFYEKIGFRVIAEENIPIGPYWMEDYVMRLELKK